MSRSSSEEDISEKLKIVVLGACGVGKSCICFQYGQGIFKDHYNPTLGVDFVMKRLSLTEGVHVVLQVWDLSGRSSGGSMLDKYLYGCQGILLVYDVTDMKSFTCLQGWLNIINDACDLDQPLPKIMLVGNKVDLEHLRVVKSEDHLIFANKNNLMHAFISAKVEDSVNKIFSRLASSLLGIKILSFPEDKVKSSIKLDVSESGDTVKPPYDKDLPLKVPPPSSAKQSTMCILS